MSERFGLTLPKAIPLVSIATPKFPNEVENVQILDFLYSSVDFVLTTLMLLNEPTHCSFSIISHVHYIEIRWASRFLKLIYRFCSHNGKVIE